MGWIRREIIEMITNESKIMKKLLPYGSFFFFFINCCLHLVLLAYPSWFQVLKKMIYPILCTLHWTVSLCILLHKRCCPNFHLSHKKIAPSSFILDYLPQPLQKRKVGCWACQSECADQRIPIHKELLAAALTFTFTVLPRMTEWCND